MHVVLDQRHVRYVLVSADEVRRFAPLPCTVYLVNIFANNLEITHEYVKVSKTKS